MKAVAFDLDGVLLDSEPVFVEAARRIVTSRGIPFEPAVMQEMMGWPGRDALPYFRQRFGLLEPLEVIADEYRAEFLNVAGGGVPLMPGAAEAVVTIRESGRALALVTSSQRAYVEAIFGPHGLLGEFNVIVTADDVRLGKPAPEPYLRAAIELGVHAGDVTVFEDSPAGVASAKAAGCRCIAVPQANTAREAVATADHLIESLLDRVAWQSLLGFS
jgi:HAD superfamily hydrolase (TIGR01509 family)